ncbi:uncharacterized protein PRCAT00000683001 [Priceomyces carsonii]|uniref:uncharacterized protein n=1 Tax=Priceomyces carsonii TaxID=28549 RepID=UPI002ED79A55|nr:unnamed protein product [Priceomyces carsonii]
MTEVFNMDDDDIILSDRISQVNLGPSELNYKLLEDAEGSPENEKNENDENNLVEEYSNSVSELPIPIEKKPRRQSAISGSYEIDISEAFISSSAKSKIYKPKITDFEPIKVLGRGAYGKVLLVREISTGKLFAQKQFKKASLIINENTNEINNVNYKRALNEKNLLEMVNHPNIVKLFYAFQDNNKVYLILEYLDGGELFHHLAQERFLSEKNASFYIAQMILALRYLHLKLKVIYRDLKPENCMLNSNGNLVLTDFGLSKVSSETDRVHSITGTVQYMAPEIIRGEPYDYRVDWWSLGCVAFDLLTGSPPFTGNNNTKIIQKILSMKKTLKYPYYLSNDAKDFLRKLLQSNPEKRLNIDENFDKAKQHRFFRNVNWDDLEHSNQDDCLLPPILPIITDSILAENFDTEFTNMPFTPPSSNLHTEDILHIDGFSFTNDHFMNSRF